MLAAGVNITALFSPEHGLAGVEDRDNISDTKDPASGLPVFSLYQASSRRIQPQMLENVDALVFDIQDVGARFYTYSCTMLYSMEAAAEKHLPFFVLDRPNPITGVHAEGPMLDPDLQSFTGCFEIPVRHGMTLGELATMANGERKLGLDLHVIPMRGWDRGDWFDATGQPWVDPSPNMRSLNQALLYPGIALLEASPNYSVGRGTDSPFELIGADWIHGRELASFLNGRYIPGVRVYPERFRPTSGNFSGKSIEGVRFVITNRDTFDSTRLGLELAYALNKLYPGKIAWQDNRFLIGQSCGLRGLEGWHGSWNHPPGNGELLGRFYPAKRALSTLSLTRRSRSGRGLGCCNFGGTLGFVFRPILAARRASATLDLRHPGGWAAATSSTSTSQPFHRHDRFLDLLPLEP